MLCPDLAESERSACSSVPIKALRVSRSCSTSRLTTTTSPIDDRSAATAVVDMSALVGAKQLQDHGLVYLPRYVRSDDPLLRVRGSIVEEFLGSLARLPGVQMCGRRGRTAVAGQ